MVGGAGFNTGIGHAERFHRFVDLPMKVHFPHVGMVAMNDPIGIIHRFQSIQRADLGFDGNPFIDGRNPFGFSGTEITIQLVALDILFRFPETHANARTQANVLATGLLFNHIPGCFDENGVGMSTQQREAMMRSQNIYTLIGLDEAHIHFAKFRFGDLIEPVQGIGAARIKDGRQFGKNFG